MNVKPILFNTPITRAILEGRKTQTRRIIKPQPTNPRWNNIGWLGWDDGHGYRMKPPCETGGILWVRETWARISDYTCVDPELGMPDGYIYRADWGNDTNQPKWRPSIYMPKEAARIFLRVNDVRIAPLQSMTTEDAKKEGAETDEWNELRDEVAVVGLSTWSLREFFGYHIWDKTITRKENWNRYGWDINPWVWVIEFERCEKPKEWSIGIHNVYGECETK